MSASSSPEKKLRSFIASDLGESLIDAVSHHDKKLAKAVLKSGRCVFRACFGVDNLTTRVELLPPANVACNVFGHSSVCLFVHLSVVL